MMDYDKRGITMYSRRLFIKRSLVATSLVAVGGKVTTVFAGDKPAMKTSQPERVLVTWFSQTGHTERIGKLMAHVLASEGLEVTSGDMRDITPSTAREFDLIMAGSPVHYFKPSYGASDWIKRIPSIEGIPVATWVTFGNDGSNQHNAACDLLEMLAEKGGVPLSINMFSNMNAFPPSLDGDRVLRYKHLPNEKTYRRARVYAVDVLNRVRENRPWEIDFHFSMYEPMKVLGMAWWTKKFMMQDHHIDENLCIRCYSCMSKCPVNAIKVDTNHVDTNRCVACMGCVNVCPTGAMKIKSFGDPVYGFREFLRKKDITIKEPQEFK